MSMYEKDILGMSEGEATIYYNIVLKVEERLSLRKKWRTITDQWVNEIFQLIDNGEAINEDEARDIIGNKYSKIMNDYIDQLVEKYDKWYVDPITTPRSILKYNLLIEAYGH